MSKKKGLTLRQAERVEDELDRTLDVYEVLTGEVNAKRTNWEDDDDDLTEDEDDEAFDMDDVMNLTEEDWEKGETT